MSTKNNNENSKKNRISRLSFYSLSFRLYGGLVLFVVFILLTSLVSGRSVLNAALTQKTLLTKNIPDLILVTSIVKQSESLIGMAPKLGSALSEKDVKAIQSDILKHTADLNKLLNELKESRASDYHFVIRDLVHQITENLKTLEDSVLKKNKLYKKLKLQAEATDRLSRKMLTVLVREIDDKTFNLAIKSQALHPGEGSDKQDPVSIDEILFYHQLLDFQSQINVVVNLLRQVMGLSDPDLMQPVRERFLAAIETCQRAAGAFPPSYRDLKEGVKKLKTFGLGKADGVFALKGSVFSIESTEKQFLRKNKIITENLLNTVQEVSSSIRSSNATAADLLEKSSKNNQKTFFIINLISLTGSLALAFFFIGPLVGRLSYLSRKMRQMSKGDLEGEIQVQGGDEIQEMASALEVFRRHALKVQKLNLVEKLAAEVQTKNHKLEQTIKDLRQTRDQLVIQEKLASLGQLTSGIAHEIKNPLNFINNFAKLSEGLAKDIVEEVKSSLAAAPLEAKKFIQEVAADLQSNLKKINIHGSRVNDIITGMLQHSRGSSGKKEPVDINKYMETYSNLAFHSKRSLDSNFKVTFKKNYDSGLKPLDLVPQDISRTILNLITNACDAVKDNPPDRPPCVELKTVKKPDAVQMIVRDNGTGIPDDLKEKIFNPFFTTKSTGQGTGLGLSLVHDIVTKYGGSLKVSSRENQFSEFVVSLPV